MIFGPPGTGKTTYLMELLGKELKGRFASKVAFASFTRQGTYEGAQRAKKQYKLSDHGLKHFRTIHSLCFKAMGTDRSSIITKFHYRELSEKTGINFTGYYTDDFSCSDDIYLHIVSMEKHNHKLANALSQEVDENKLDFVRFQYAEMKKQIGIIDFDDLLLNYEKHGKPLPVEVAFIDEGQDLTPLQWRIVAKLFGKAKKIYVAGDDDQSVFAWAGADVKRFLAYSRKQKVLTHSYRVPFTVHKIASRIAKDISVRKEKKYTPRDAVGHFENHATLNDVPIEGGELVLCRTNRLLQGMAESLNSMGIPYRYKGKLSIDRQLVKGIHTYEQCQEGKVSVDELSKYSSYFPEMHSSKPWYTALSPEYNANYYKLAMPRIKQKPVLLETFHSSKGSENDHVILDLSMTNRVDEGYRSDPDAELRCLYTAVTRAKNRLTVLAPSTQHHYPGHYFMV